MDTCEHSLGGAAFAPRPPDTAYLDTAACGLGPVRTTTALRQALDDWSAGDLDALGQAVADARAAFGRLVAVPAGRVAVGPSLAVQVSLVAAGLPAGAEVLAADGDFSSLVNPFAMRGDLKLRSVPLDSLADEVRPETALVAVSSVQSADGRTADLDSIRRAAAAYGARVLVDTTQSAGWLPLAADDFDFTVCAPYKWLLCPRGVSFLTVAERAMDAPVPAYASWAAGEVPADSNYGPLAALAGSARRFDSSPAQLPYLGAPHSLALVEEIGTAAIAAHNLALADRFRAGLTELGRTAVPPVGAGSPIVAVPGLGGAAARLKEAGVTVSSRAGHLRASFHLYNTAAEVDRLLALLGEARPDGGGPA